MAKLNIAQIKDNLQSCTTQVLSTQLSQVSDGNCDATSTGWYVLFGSDWVLVVPSATAMVPSTTVDFQDNSTVEDVLNELEALNIVESGGFVSIIPGNRVQVFNPQPGT